jgi:diadenosine tetraphosphatase ApaH/serine/threonine PP2A family protein phosphatase
VYGFYDECVTKYGSANAWKYCIAVFDLLGIAALIEDSYGDLIFCDLLIYLFFIFASSLLCSLTLRIFCVHGGLSPNAQTMDQIRQISMQLLLYLSLFFLYFVREYCAAIFTSYSFIARDIEVPIEGALCDFMWSDPEDIEGWESSPRGGGWLFGTRPTREFIELNQFSLIARAHQLVAGTC